MAGSYNDAPSRRMAWDADGSVMVHRTSGALSVVSDAATAVFNNEQSVSAVGYSADGASWAILFPELREIDGIFLRASGSFSTGSFTVVDTSADTTTGVDGTWTTAIADYTDQATKGNVYDEYRDYITSLAVATEKAVRFLSQSHSDGLLRAAHVYGIISPGETPDRLLFLDTAAADSEFTKPLDYGDVPRGQSQTSTLKVKNNSASKTINTVQVTAEDLYGDAGDWYTFSTDGSSYSASLLLGDLGPAASQLVYVKQNIPDSATPGVWAGRIRASHASLT